MPRKTPIQHDVRSHTREGKPVRGYTRGSGIRIRRRRRVIEVESEANQLAKLAEELPVRQWAVDTEYTSGESGWLGISPFVRGGYSRIGPDLIVAGSLSELFDQIYDGKIGDYLEINDYSREIKQIEVTGSGLTQDEREYLKLYQKVTGTDVDLYEV